MALSRGHGDRDSPSKGTDLTRASRRRAYAAALARTSPRPCGDAMLHSCRHSAERQPISADVCVLHGHHRILAPRAASQRT